MSKIRNQQKCFLVAIVFVFSVGTCDARVATEPLPGAEGVSKKVGDDIHKIKSCKERVGGFLRTASKHNAKDVADEIKKHLDHAVELYSRASELSLSVDASPEVADEIHKMAVECQSDYDEAYASLGTIDDQQLAGLDTTDEGIIDMGDLQLL